MKKQINIELPDFCEGCKQFELECKKVHASNLDGDTITMDYYSCRHRDFCCYQHRRLDSGSSTQVARTAESILFKFVCSGCSGCCNCFENGNQFECERYKEYYDWLVDKGVPLGGAE